MLLQHLFLLLNSVSFRFLQSSDLLFIYLIKRMLSFYSSINLISKTSTEYFYHKNSSLFLLKQIPSFLLLYINRFNYRTIIRLSFLIHPFHINCNVIYTWLFYIFQSTCECSCINILRFI